MYCIALCLFVSVVAAFQGDINRDGIVDGYDLSILAGSFGSQKGDRSYNPESDLTGKGSVDEDDLSVLLSQFGRSADEGTPLRLIKTASESSEYDVSVADPLLFDESCAILRYRYVDLTEGITTGSDIEPGDTIILNLFDDSEYRASIDRVHVNINGTIAVRGRIENLEYGSFIVSTTDGISLATVDLPETDTCFTITNDAESGRHILMEIDRHGQDILQNILPVLPPPETYGEIAEQKRLAQSIAAAGYGEDDHASIGMMIVYTPAAAAWASSRGGIHNVVSQAIERAQLTFENSQIIASANLVHSGQVDYVESGSSYIDLYRLTTSPNHKPWGDEHEGHKISGYMDEVHIWRDAFGADLVALFAEVNDVGGLGFLLTSPGGRPQYGFSLTRVQQAATSYTHIHETGHNMGAHHHREQLDSPGPGMFSYSAGWRWTGNDNGRYCSVMTYESGQYFADGNRHTAVGYFSNPDVNHAGVPTGHREQADNARTLREVKHVIASYRTASDTVPEAPSNLRYTILSTPAVHLKWNDNAMNAGGFIVEKRTDGDWVQIGTTGAATLSFTDRDISFSTTCFYRVAAFNQKGTSEYSNTVEVSIGMGW